MGAAGMLTELAMRARLAVAGFIAEGLNFAILAGGGLAAALLVPASPIFLPHTACQVSEAKYEALAMQIPYAEAVRALGCEGVRVRDEKIAKELTIVEYAWRADTWPYGAVRAEFYNDTLQSKSALRYKLSWTGRE